MFNWRWVKILCPVCKNVNLLMTERQGVEIDYCPTCRGVWLDRGELDKIIERSVTPQQSRPEDRYAEHGEHREHDAHHGYGGQKDEHYGQKRHRKGSFLGDLFDFGGDD